MSNKPVKRHQLAGVKKVHESKVYDYIKKIEIDGLPRLRAYAEAIDPGIYDLSPSAANRKLDRVREEYPTYNELRELVLAERADWAMKKSYAVQDKAVSLLLNVVDKANKIIEDEDSGTKELAAATNVLRSIMPALKTVNENGQPDAVLVAQDRSKKIAKYIN